MTWKTDYSDCLEYIDNYWNKIIFQSSRMKLRHSLSLFKDLLTDNDKKAVFITIPHAYFVPNDNKFIYIFYWDSFFMFRGLMGTKRQWLMKEQVENFLYLFNKYRIVPNFNAPASMGRSQPPFLSSMIMDTYFTPLNKTNPFRSHRFFPAKIFSSTRKSWLKKAIETAKREYDVVWIDKENSYNHSVHGYTLSRYGDRDVGYAHSSELESGWDLTSRFYNHCDQFLPVDLNSYLYKYELDFSKAARILGNKGEYLDWHNRSLVRKAEVNDCMWNEGKGFFFDYGYVQKQQSHFLSLAGYTPMWAGLATYEQAKRMLGMLPKFETPFGLTITAKESLAEPIDLSKIQPRYHAAIEEIIKPKQWDYPSIWSPLEYLTVTGLLRYGFIEDAKRIMENSVRTHARLFRHYGTFFEKLNGETGQQSTGFHYAMQQGFGWTNAVFFRYIQLLDAMEDNVPLFAKPQPDEPPFELAVLN